MSFPRPPLSRAAVLAALAAVAGALPALSPRPACAQQTTRRAGVHAGAGPALGGERNFLYAKLTVPIEVGGRWAVGPSAAAFSEIDVQEGSASDDRFAVGLAVRRALGEPGGSLFTYAGARGMYAFSKGAGSGAYGGVLVGVQYAPGHRLAAGLEGQVLRGPEAFLFAPLATVTLRF